jgi:hypothetical protein
MVIGIVSTIVACSDVYQQPDPSEIAKSNMESHYTLRNGSMIPLSEAYCDPQGFTARNGMSYLKCNAKLSGYAHFEVHFCPTKPKHRCLSERPD